MSAPTLNLANEFHPCQKPGKPPLAPPQRAPRQPLPKPKKPIAKATKPIARKVAPPKKKTRSKALAAKWTAERYDSPEFVSYVVALPCIICGRLGCDPAHLRGNMGKKSGPFVPMCSDDVRVHFLGCHAEYDGRKVCGGRETFFAKYGLTRRTLEGIAQSIRYRFTSQQPADEFCRGFAMIVQQQARDIAAGRTP